MFIQTVYSELALPRKHRFSECGGVGFALAIKGGAAPRPNGREPSRDVTQAEKLY